MKTISSRQKGIPFRLQAISGRQKALSGSLKPISGRMKGGLLGSSWKIEEFEVLPVVKVRTNQKKNAPVGQWSVIR